MLEFQGFDGNDRKEVECLAYARFFCSMGDRFSDIKKGDDFNSHMPTLDMYINMVAEWEKSNKKYELTKEDIARITSVK